MKIWIIAGVFALALLFFCKKPLLVLLKLLANAAVGMGLIFAANTISGTTLAGINRFNTAVTALLGVPGGALLCILNKII